MSTDRPYLVTGPWSIANDVVSVRTYLFVQLATEPETAYSCATRPRHRRSFLLERCHRTCLL
ncbi:hypothetical protein JMJ77_0004407, partial [Colletotrichum scovillei]